MSLNLRSRNKKKAKKELKKAKKQQKKVAKQRFASEVVAHLDAEEVQTAQPGTMLLKTWKVKNTGTVAWSEETKSEASDDEKIAAEVEEVYEEPVVEEEPEPE